MHFYLCASRHVHRGYWTDAIKKEENNLSPNIIQPQRLGRVLVVREYDAQNKKKETVG